MPIRTLPGLLVLLLCGCQAAQVAQNAVTLGGEAKYVQEQQVLNNLAMLAADPSALPSFATMIQGQDQLARTAQITYTPNWDLITAAGSFFGRYILDKQSAALSGTKQNQESIQVSPTSDPDKLLLLQAAFHRALGIDDPYQVALQAALTPAVPTPTQPLEVKIVGSMKETAAEEPAKSRPTAAAVAPPVPMPASSNWQHYEEMITSGWFQVCKKKDVPKHACRVGCYCGTYVYVLPGDEGDLARMTFAILHLVSLDLSKLVVPPTRDGYGGAGVPGTPLAPPRIQTLPFFPTLPAPSPT
ncbi:MAG TPA: hypothetical protein VH643_26405 [Gemmataceae bacterium]|jgi:hypothetical protein